MRKLASIQEIKELRPIENADSLEVAKVLGWDVVVRKGEFKKGQKVVYFEIDSFLPVVDEYEFLRKTSYKKSEILGEGFRLKTIRLRGQLSQGLILPIETCFKDCMPVDKENGFEIGEDVTELLNIKKWEDPEPASLGGDAVGRRPDFIIKTDETRVQSEPKLLEELSNCEEVYISLKMDGSSHSVGIDKNNNLRVTSHNMELKETDRPGSFYRFVIDNGIDLVLKTLKKDFELEEIVLQGEYCGPGIQKNKLMLQKPEWYVFNVYFNGKRQSLNTLLNITEANGIKHVPIIATYTGSEFKKMYPDPETILTAVSNYTDPRYKNSIPEGWVIRPTKPTYSEVLNSDLSMKVVNNKYLLKQDN